MAWNLKDEKDAEKYIENLGTEYRFGCFHEKKPEVCHLLGDFMEAVKKDWAKAARVYKVNCEDYNYGHSCYKLGNYTFMGKGEVKIDHALAVTYYDKGCELNFADACLHAGLMRSAQASQVPKDPVLALTKFEKGCSLNSDMCCFYLSGMYISGVDNSVQKDMLKAFEFSQKACHLGNVYACSNLSQMYRKGDGTPKDEIKADEYRKLATEMQDQVVKQFRSIKFEEGG
ncbi:cytochrome c oxidase assembly factor 7 homolog [Folsomia candida]|nr:cytochrome c oxidase assembly factor 7 homolog [Folsomia candida]